MSVMVAAHDDKRPDHLNSQEKSLAGNVLLLIAGLLTLSWLCWSNYLIFVSLGGLVIGLGLLAPIAFLLFGFGSFFICMPNASRFLIVISGLMICVAAMFLVYSTTPNFVSSIASRMTDNGFWAVLSGLVFGTGYGFLVRMFDRLFATTNWDKADINSYSLLRTILLTFLIGTVVVVIVAPFWGISIGIATGIIIGLIAGLAIGVIDVVRYWANDIPSI
jgi:hypothetical protein